MKSVLVLLKTILLIASLTIVHSCNYAQSVSNHHISKIDKKDLKYILKVLSSDSLEGRLTGSAGQKKAAAFIAGKFKEFNLIDSLNGNYLQKFTLNCTYWGETYLKLNNRFLTNFEDFVFLGPLSQNTEIEKEVVFGGYGTKEQLDAIKVENRLVLVFSNNVRNSFEIQKMLKEKKASGIILANPSNDKQFEAIKHTFQNFILSKRFSFPDLNRKHEDWDIVNEFVIPNSEIKNIIGLNIEALNKLIENQNLEKCPISKVKLKCEKITEQVEAQNVFGMIKGKSNKSIVISAHYDHLGSRKGFYYPGADDNASGVSALLELAEAFSTQKELNYNLIFLATTGEEQGMFGSHYFLSKTFASSILINLNIDMISRIDEKHQTSANYLYCIGTETYPNLNSLLEKSETLSNECKFDYSMDNIKDLTGLYHRSDQYNFAKKGIPALMLFTGLHDDYHKTTDTYDKINVNLLQSRIKLIYQLIEILEKEEIKK